MGAGKWITINVTVNATDEQWRGERGQADFQVTLPYASLKAVDVSALMPGLVERAREELAGKLAEQPA